jgi:beta-xylosidase
MNIEKLTPDFYHISDTPRYVFPETFVEAPVLFKTNGTYYALYDWCCCYCMQGSGIMVYRGDSPLGPYTQQVSSILSSCFLLKTNIIHKFVLI